MHFTDKDVEQFIELLNLIALKGEFKLTIKDSIHLNKLLNWAQKDCIAKMKANIFEVVSVTEPPK